jgi:hypothetical protein
MYYPNGDHLLNNAATHTIPAQKGHIEVTVPANMIMNIYQVGADGGRSIQWTNLGMDRSQDKKYTIIGAYGGPDYLIELSYPESALSGKTIVYNIDFYYYDTIYGADAEPNDTKDTAIAMSENTSYEGWGHSYYSVNNTTDYYKIVAQKRGDYVITTNANGTQPDINTLKVYFMGNNAKPFPSDYYSEGGSTSGPLKVYCVEKGDELFILVQADFNSYNINYTVEESTDESDVEPNDTAEQATSISENIKMNGTIGYGEVNRTLPKDSEDYYKIVPATNGKLIINFKEKIEVPENFITFYFKDTNGQLSGLNTTALTVNNQTFEIDCASPNKTYFVKLNKSNFYISPNYSCCNAYEISWNMQDTSNAGCGFLDTADFKFNDGLNIFPNPATDTLQLKVKNNQTINQITIRDITGKTVMSPTFNNNTVDIKKLNSGIYFLQAKINDKTVTQKFIKK